MIYFVKNGIRVDEKEWSGAYPRPDRDPNYSSCDVSFKNGVSITLTEGFLRHALELIEFHRKSVEERFAKKDLNG